MWCETCKKYRTKEFEPRFYTPGTLVEKYLDKFVNRLLIKPSDLKTILLMILIAIVLPAGTVVAGRKLNIDSVPAKYNASNKYVSDAFPRKLVSHDFSIPVNAEQLIVIYPVGLEKQARIWQNSLKERVGVELPFLAADKVTEDELRNRNLIMMGSINDNPLVMELYKQRYAFADGYFPGEGGFVITPGTSAWNYNLNVINIGASRTEDLDAAFRAFLDQIGKNARSIGAVRMLQTQLDVKEPPQSVKNILDGVIKNENAIAPYLAIADWGLSYHLTGNKKWAEHFRDAIYMIRDRARNTGYWVSEPWTNVYFYFGNLILAWELIDDDPYFTSEDRKVAEEVLWGITNYVNWMPNLNPDQAPSGEMRQNHTTFLAMSLYFSYRYYTRKYSMEKELAPMIAKVHQAFEMGQANSFIPNDDAGGYIHYAPLHTMTYLFSEHNMSYVESNKLARTADLIAATFDNRGDEVSFGDVGSYFHNDITGLRTNPVKFFSMSARFYDQPRYKWFYQWLSTGKRFNLNSLYSGDYAGTNTATAAEAPSEYTGIQVVRLDTAARAWFGRRSWDNKRLPLASDDYFHKIAFRRSFNPGDEYLLLDGISGLSHGHHDGNSILRLTWKDRIWLFDLDYNKYNTKYHNGVTIVRNGMQEDPPLLTRLDFTAEGTDLGLTRSTAQDYSGADWERTILWRKGDWFFVLDRIKARENGEYRLINRWRTRGEVSLENRRLKAIQGDKSFYIKSADRATRHLTFEPDGGLNNWSSYPWGKGGLDVLTARQEVKLNTGGDFTFANLLAASDDTNDVGYDLTKVTEHLYHITGTKSSVLIGSDAEWLMDYGISTDASMFLIEPEALHLIDLSRLKIQGAVIGNLPRCLTIDLQAGVLKDFKGSTIKRLEPALIKSFQHAITAALDRSSGVSYEVNPDPNPSNPENFGFTLSGHLDWNTPVTAYVRHPEGVNSGVFLGDAAGQILLINKDLKDRTIRTPAGAEITALATGDLNGDGSQEIIAGDKANNLYCYSTDGKLLWQYKLTPYRGTNAYATDIAIDKIDNGGQPVILVGTVGWLVYAFEPSGGVRWKSFIYYHPVTRVGVLDDGAGKRYVVAGTEYHTPFNVIDPQTGIVIYHAWQEMGSEFISSTEYYGIHLTDMTFFDADGDGKRDLIFGTLSNHVYAVNAADGKKIWEINAGGEVTVIKQFEEPGTSNLRLLVANDAGDISVFDNNGKRLHRALLGSYVTDIRILPVEGGRTDIAVTTRGGDLVVLDDSLLVRAAHHFDKPVESVDLIGREGPVFQLMVTGNDFVQRIDYEAFFLRKSSRY